MTENFNAIPDYQIYYNIGTMGPGAAIITCDAIPLQRTNKLPSGGGTAVTNHDILFVKIHGPSGNDNETRNGRIFQHGADIYYAKCRHIASLVVVSTVLYLSTTAQ
jgi:hypothetical protein